MHAFINITCTHLTSMAVTVSGGTELTPGQARIQAISESFVQDRFNASSSVMLTIVGLFVIVAIASVGTMLKMRDVRRLGPQYRALASALELRWWEALLLQRIARGLGLTNATGLLISEGTFDRLTETYLQSHTRQHRRYDMIAGIRARLFADVESRPAPA